MTVESSGNQLAMRYEPHYKYTFKPHIYADAHRMTLATEIELQKFSYGLMQIMGATARELGFKDHFAFLLDAVTGFSWGCLYFARLLDRFPNYLDAISAYNQGSPRKTLLGKYKNQKYVDKVLMAAGSYGEKF
jgi:hypothetical protein